jgi:EpsD family peptidyl-prolyl cis-trans isomerase
MNRRPNNLSLALASGLIVLTLTGCDGLLPSADADGQVVATVNGREISLLQFQHALDRTGRTDPDATTQRAVLDKLVDRDLAVAAALESGLDRQPEVLLQLEEARRDVLARAWAERTATRQTSASDDSIARYFSAHPELFSERKIYRLREAALPQDLPQLDEAKRRFVTGASLESVVDWIRSEQGRINDQVVIRAAEQLPIESLARFGQAKAGDTLLFETPRGVLAYQVIDVQQAPLAWEQARPIIARYLAKRTGKQEVEAEIEHLRRTSTIAYAEGFRDPMRSPGVTPP